VSKPRIQEVLENRFPSEIVEHIISSFREVEQNYRLEKWKTSELDAGHFVEAVRRLIEHELTQSFTSFSSELGSFSPQVLTKFENGRGPEELRILVPRVLYAMYCIRNKRGVGHLAAVSPNKLDATFILHSAKWVLGELLRLSGSNSPDEAKILVDEALYRHVDLVWDDGETYMVLSPSLKAADRTLLVLYRQNRLDIENLRAKVEYKDKIKYRKILSELQNKRMLSVTQDGFCKISPVGERWVEEKILTKP
jgi:hypothetical protein